MSLPTGMLNRDACDSHTGALELPREIGAGGFAFDGRIHCKAACEARMTANPEVISSPVGLVPTNALVF